MARTAIALGHHSMVVTAVIAIVSPHTDVLGHRTNRSFRHQVSNPDLERAPSELDAEIVFAACAHFGTAVEINCRPKGEDPPNELVELDLEWDWLFAIDSKAHAPGQMEWQVYGCEKAARQGIELERIVNSWGAHHLVSWAAGNATQ